MNTTAGDLEAMLGVGKVTAQKDISPYFTLRTNVTAQFFFETETREDLLNVGKLKASGVPVFLLGGGSNLAVTKSLIEGLVVRNMYQKKEIKEYDKESVEVAVSSGYPIARLVAETVNEGFAGLEYQLGLPGTVGGAIYMNSKWTKPNSYCGDHLVYAYLVDGQGNEKKVDRDYFQFAYDTSILQKTKEILLEAVFRLKKEQVETVKKRSRDALEYRKATQPFGVSTSGCFFRNISVEDQTRLNLPTTSAGYLIDQSGLKNMKVGEFSVSEKHANFIINNGNGDPQDLVSLIQKIKAAVKEKYGIELHEEVIVV